MNKNGGIKGYVTIMLPTKLNVEVTNACIFACSFTFRLFNSVQRNKQEAQGLGALLDKMEDSDHIELVNIEI